MLILYPLSQSQYNNYKYIKAKAYKEIFKDYFNITGRRISFEYALIDGVNDQPEHAMELIKLLKGMGAHVNLIPVNKVNETGYKRGKRESVEAFAKLLNDNGQNATIRRELGSDINAACGQLRQRIR